MPNILSNAKSTISNYAVAYQGNQKAKANINQLATIQAKKSFKTATGFDFSPTAYNNGNMPTKHQMLYDTLKANNINRLKKKFGL